jgi:FdhD protein
MSEQFRSVHAVEVSKVHSARVDPARDVVAVEEPLEIRLHGSPFVVIMRTPGADRELTAGFLLSERVIESADDLGVIEYCQAADLAGKENTVNVTLAGQAASRVPELLNQRRAVSAHAACGVCGRRSIDDLMQAAARVQSPLRVPSRVVVELPGRLRAAQMAFEQTGGLHAAGLFDSAGRLAASAEDVGRHNAVDKLVGARLMMDDLPLSGRLLFVSGRVSFEIVQKAIVAGIPVVGAISAPSSLAIDLARDGGVTLLGFVRDGHFNVYTHGERIEGG